MTSDRALADAIRGAIEPESAVLSNEQEVNYRSHSFGPVDDAIRCFDCEIGVWAGHRSRCIV